MKTPKVAFNMWFGTILVRFLSLQRFVAEMSTLVADTLISMVDTKICCFPFHKVAGFVM